MNETKDLVIGLIDALKPLAAKIGEGAETIYRGAVRDAMITGTVELVWCSLGVVLCFIFAILWKKAMQILDSEKELSSGKVAAVAWCFGGGAGLAILGLVLIFANFSDCLHHLLNPEYEALKELLRQVK